MPCPMRFGPPPIIRTFLFELSTARLAMFGVIFVLEYKYGVRALNSPAQVSTSLYSRVIFCLVLAK